MADLWEDVEALSDEFRVFRDEAGQEIADLKAKVESLEKDQVEIYGMIQRAGVAGTLLGAGLRELTQTLRERGVL